MSDVANDTTERTFVTPLAAALHTGVSARTVRNWVQQGKVSTQGAPPRRLVSLQDVQSLAANVQPKSVTAALESAAAASVQSERSAQADTSWIAALGSITVIDDTAEGVDGQALDEKALTSVYGFPLESPQAPMPQLASALPQLTTDFSLYPEAEPASTPPSLPAPATDAALQNTGSNMPVVDLLNALQMQYERSLAQVLAANERERAARDSERQQILEAAQKNSSLLREQASIRQRQIHDVRQANHALLQAAQLREVVIQLREQEITALRAALQQAKQQIVELQVELKRARRQAAPAAEPRPTLTQLICEPETPAPAQPARKTFQR